MLRNYSEELNQLHAAIEKQEATVHNAVPHEYLEILLRLRKLWVFYRYWVERNIANDAPRGIRILYAKMSNCLIGLLHLLDQGYPGPAAMVIRSLFETYVHLKIILKEDTVARAQLLKIFRILNGSTPTAWKELKELQHIDKSIAAQRNPKICNRLDSGGKLRAKLHRSIFFSPKPVFIRWNGMDSGRQSVCPILRGPRHVTCTLRTFLGGARGAC